MTYDSHPVGRVILADDLSSSASEVEQEQVMAAMGAAPAASAHRIEGRLWAGSDDVIHRPRTSTAGQFCKKEPSVGSASRW